MRPLYSAASKIDVGRGNIGEPISTLIRPFATIGMEFFGVE
jgi:hypothetical protein